MTARGDPSYRATRSDRGALAIGYRLSNGTPSDDAQRTLAHFAADLRNEVDLAALTAELQRVAVEALQPVSASVWLRERAP